MFQTIQKYRILIVIAALLLVAGIIFFASRSNGKVSYITKEIKKGRIVQSVSSTGTVNPEILVQVGSQISGTLKHIYVDFNSKVKKGTLLALIDPDQIQAQTEQAKNSYYSSKSAYEQAKIQMENAKKAYERSEKLFKEGLISKADMDTSETSYLSLKAAVDVAYSNVNQAKSGYDANSINLYRTRIRSPIDGIVVSRNVDVGQTVAASLQAPVLFLIAKDITKMEVYANIDEADIGKIKEKQKVMFYVDAFPEKRFEGVVKQVRLNPTTVQNVVTYTAVVGVDNSDLLLKPGMTANLEFIVAVKESVIKVPNSAFRFKPQGIEEPKKREKTSAGTQTVWLYNKDGSVKSVPVKTGISDKTFTEIIEGLKEGDSVIVGTASDKKGSAPHGPGGGGKMPRIGM